MNNRLLNFWARPGVPISGTAFAAMAVFGLLFAAATALRADPPLPGAIFTTDSTCSGVDLNIYGLKTDVYIDGGPAHHGAASLPDECYYVQVTSPQGTLLGTSVGSGNEKPFCVSGGEPVSCYQLWDILIKASDSSKGYDDTDNDGGEYKVWVSTESTFTNNSTKTDNFKVREGGGGPGDTSNLCVDKFYDANVNGNWDAGETEITGWEFTLFGTVGFDTMQIPHTDTPWCGVVDPDTFHVTEADALAPPTWLHTTDPMVSITVVAGQNGEVDFGNVCLGGRTGALTIGFWSNKNGLKVMQGGSSSATALEISFLDGLNLRNANGTNFDPSTLAAFQTWILNANATNMAYMLSAQLAAMELNVRHNYVSGSAIVYAPGCGDMGLNNQFITIEHLMAAANSELGLHGSTPSGNQFRAYQEALKNALDEANNNRNFVQGSASQCGTPRFPSN